jgi:hypothetical protein
LLASHDCVFWLDRANIMALLGQAVLLGRNCENAAYWFFPTEFDENIQAASQGYISGNEGVFGIDNAYNTKIDGLSVRCVMDY